MRVVYDNEAEWLEARKGKITSTLASAILGLNPFMNKVDAWEIITGNEMPKDLSKVEAVMKGKEAEHYIFGLFALDHPEFKATPNSVDKYYMYVSDKYSFLTASGDGEVSSNGTRGGIEIKTARLRTKKSKESWNGTIPKYYLCQCLLEMYCGNLDFVVLVAELMFDDSLTERRCYMLQRKDFENEINEYVEKLVSFYNENVVTNKRPSVEIGIL